MWQLPFAHEPPKLPAIGNTPQGQRFSEIVTWGKRWDPKWDPKFLVFVNQQSFCFSIFRDIPRLLRCVVSEATAEMPSFSKRFSPASS